MMWLMDVTTQTVQATHSVQASRWVTAKQWADHGVRLTQQSPPVLTMLQLGRPNFVKTGYGGGKGGKGKGKDSGKAGSEKATVAGSLPLWLRNDLRMCDT